MLTDKFCSLQFDVRKCISRGRPRHKCECDCVREGEGEGEEGKLDTASWFRLPASRVVCFLEWRGRRERYGRYGGNYGRGKSVLLSTFQVFPSEAGRAKGCVCIELVVGVGRRTERGEVICLQAELAEPLFISPSSTDCASALHDRRSPHNTF